MRTVGSLAQPDPLPITTREKGLTDMEQFVLA